MNNPAKMVEIGDYTYRVVGDEDYYRGCKRCGGSGYYMFNGSDSVCYLCNNDHHARLGTFVGTHEDAVKDAAKRTKARNARIAKKEAARMVEVRKLEAKVAAVREIAPEVADFLVKVELNDWILNDRYEPVEENPNYEKDTFIRNMAEQLQFVTNASRPFTEKMIAAVQRNIDKRNAKAAEKDQIGELAEGRYTIEGEIVSAKVVESDFGTAYKVLVKLDNGQKVYGSLAKNIADEFYDRFYEIVETAGYSRYDFGSACWFLGTELGTFENVGVKGARIRFDAKVERSRDDKTFGFFSRPTKASIVEEVVA